MVHPAKLARELARVAAELGVEIFEGTRATGISGTGQHGPVTVTTTGGKVRSAASFTVTHVQPDGLIRAPGTTADLGDGVYNGTGLRQTATTSATRGSVKVFRIRVQNDGDRLDSVLVSGPGGVPGFRVRYLAGTTPVTTAVTTGTYLLSDISPGTGRTLRLEVTVGNKAAAGATATWLVQAASSSDPARRDAVRARVRVTP
jgi:hypothetical protein